MTSIAYSRLLILIFCCTYITPVLPQATATQQAQPPINDAMPQKSETIQKKSEAEVSTKIVSEKHEITIGSTLPLKGEVAVLGNDVFDGINLFFNKIKKSNLPFFYDFDALDDRAEITKTRANLKKLYKKSPLFFSFMENDAIETVREIAPWPQSLLLFPLNGSSMYRKSDQTGTIFFRASHTHELEALIRYSIDSLNEKKIAIFYEASEWGEDAYVSAKKILASHDLSSVAESSYQQHTINVARAARDIADSAPDAIICIARARPAYNFIRQIINKGLYKTVILGLSSLITIQNPLKRSRGIKIVTASVVPDPGKSMLKIAEEYRADMKQYTPNKQLTPFSFEGYINAALLVECTKLMRFPFTVQGLLKQIERLGHVRFKGLTLKFNSETRTLCHDVWLNTGEDEEWILYEQGSKK